MKFKKTSSNERITYTYHFADGTDSKITPNENDVTIVDIKTLHSIDDSEVYYNIKNSRCQLSEEEKLAIKEWEANNLGKKFKKHWNISVDALMQGDDAIDKSRIMLEMATSTNNNELSNEILLLREFIETLPNSQQQLYQLKYIEYYSQTEIAEILGVSNMAITNRVKRLEETIKNNFEKFYREGLKND